MNRKQPKGIKIGACTFKDPKVAAKVDGLPL